MNLIFWRNVLSVLFIIAFVLDLIFGNGVERWWDWFCGAVFVGALGNLVSTFEKRHGKRKIFRFDEDFVSNVLDGLVVIAGILLLVFSTHLNRWDYFVGAGCAFALRNLILTFRNR